MTIKVCVCVCVCVCLAYCYIYFVLRKYVQLSEIANDWASIYSPVFISFETYVQSLGCTCDVVNIYISMFFHTFVIFVLQCNVSYVLFMKVFVLENHV